MKRSYIYNKRRDFFQNEHKYSLTYYKDFDYKIFDNIMYIKRAGQGHDESYDDVIIMFDTETSKEMPDAVCRNYVVAWTLSVRAFDTNIVTLYGSKPSELVYTIDRMRRHFQGDKTILYCHNLSYDWTFLRKFMFIKWGTPDKQLNTKSHYPLFIEFNNGVILKDSLILAQRNLEKWANDLDVEHKKAVGKWNYEKIRHQKDIKKCTKNELLYIENDTLAGVECIQKTMNTLNKKIYSMPYTATGIPREAVRTIGKENHARDLFKRIVPEYRIQQILEMVYHGGYTHANRHYISRTVKGLIEAYDFSSSYPFVMLSEKYPMERFSPSKNCKVEHIIRNSEKYAYIFKLILINPRLKDDSIPMPALQYSKCVKTVNTVEDNGRILSANYVEIYLNEIDLQIIKEQYTWQSDACIEVYSAMKDYLPRWFTDYVFKCYEDKCTLKGGDPVLYSISKAKLNSLYGMLCMHPCRLSIDEDYVTGDYNTNTEIDLAELYEKYVKKFTSILPYQFGVWVTSYAFKNLFTLGKCVDTENGGVWLYSDTDSCYATKWDKEKINAYNENCKKKLEANGYSCVVYKDREYWLGVAEHDGSYSQFRTCGSKKYAVRYARTEENKKDKKAGKLKITVAGVPKKGVKCLKNNINNFSRTMVFDGKTTGKLQHTYFYEPQIWIDENENERGDSIDLSPTTYILDDVNVVDWESLFTEEVGMQIYYEGDFYEL